MAQMKYKETQHLRQWDLLIVIGALIMVGVTILVQMIISGQPNRNLLLVTSLSILILSGLFYYIHSLKIIARYNEKNIKVRMLPIGTEKRKIKWSDVVESEIVELPKFSKIDMQDPVKQRVFLKKWLQVSVWLIIPIVLFDWLGKPLFVWLNGSAYEKSFSIFVIFSIGIWLSMMFSPLVNIIISKGELRFLFIVSLLALIFNMVGNLLLIPIIGGVGAAIVVILTQNVFIQIPILVRGVRQS